MYKTHKLPRYSSAFKRQPTYPTPSTYHSMLACDAEGVRVDSAAGLVTAFGTWISSENTAPHDGSCCIKLRHASTYLVKMKTATKKKKRKTNWLVTHLAQVGK